MKSLNGLMQSVCLRRTKDVLLNLPRKVKHAVVVRNGSHWEKWSQELHATFIWMFGRLQTSEEQWDPAVFFPTIDDAKAVLQSSNLCERGASGPPNLVVVRFGKYCTSHQQFAEFLEWCPRNPANKGSSCLLKFCWFSRDVRKPSSFTQTRKVK